VTIGGSVSFEDRQLAIKYKEKGNEAFKANDLSEALLVCSDFLKLPWSHS
jgi:hypothetical protein